MTQVPISQRERGYAYESYWSQIFEEMVPELRWPNNLRVYARMQTDAQVSSVLQAVMAPIMRTGWRVDGRAVPTEIATFVAACLGLPLVGDDSTKNPQAQLRGRDRFSWNQHLFEALDMLPMGHSVFEQAYRWDPEISRWRLRKLGFRPAQTIAKFNIADDGGLESVEQYARTGTGLVTSMNTKPIKIDRLVVYSHGRRGANWRGNSVLRACYKNWLLKDDGMRSWAIGVQRNSMGLPVHKAGGTGQGEVDRGLEIATRARAGDNSGVSIGKDASFTLEGVKGTLIDPDKFVRYQDEQIARAVLAHFLNLGTQTGSWALGSTFADFFTLALQAIAEEIRNIGSAHIVEDLVDINFGRTAPAPPIVFDEIGSRRAAQALEELRKAAGLEDDEDMAQFIREHVPAAA